MALKPERPVILIAAEDPGAANALAPVAARLIRDHRVAVTALCRPLAGSVFESFGIPFERVESDQRLAETAVADVFASAAPQLALIGTGENHLSLDRFCLLQARKLGIPAVGVVDYWTRYVQRFSGPTPEERLRYLPDLIFVMDEAVRDAMVAEGVQAERLAVSGHPYLDGYAERIPWFSKEEEARFREGLGLEADQHLITFVSETLDDWKADDSYRFPPLSASRERTIVILEHLLAALTEVVQKTGTRLLLVNKLHPKNRLEEFAWLGKAEVPFPVRSIQEIDKARLLQASSLVVGMTSMLLVEAVCLGVPTLSVVPLPHEERYGPNGRQSWEVVRSPEELRGALGRLLEPGVSSRWREVARAIHEQHRGATHRIVERLYQKLGFHSFDEAKTGSPSRTI